MKPGKLTRRFVLYPLLFVGGCHTLLTGSLMPTWHLEQLNSPVSVETIVPAGLVLGDGQTQKLPLVKRTPADDPLMLAAVKKGVEIAEDGKVFGLLWVDRTCGNDPCMWYRHRVNLAALAVFLAPENLDESQTPAAVIAEIREYHRHFVGDSRSRRHNEGRIDGTGFFRAANAFGD